MNVHKCLRWPDMSKSLHSFNMLQQIPKGGMWILLNQLKIIVSYVITNVWHLYCSFHSEKFSNIHRSREKSTVNPFVGTTSLNSYQLVVILFPPGASCKLPQRSHHSYRIILKCSRISYCLNHTNFSLCKR